MWFRISGVTAAAAVAAATVKKKKKNYTGQVLK